MPKLKNILQKLSLAVLTVALAPLTSVSALTPTILVQPNDNLSKTSDNTLAVTGAGLEAGARIDVIQKSFGPGGLLENRPRGSFVVSSTGTITGSVVASYDARPDQAQLDYCDTIPAEGKLCVLEFRYFENSTQNGTVIIQQKLYFGMAGPDVTPPPVTTGPVTKDDCKDSKWGTFTTLGFKNQGACVSFVASKS